MPSPEAWSPPPRFALRPPWSPRAIDLAGRMLESTVLLAIVAAGAGGAFRGGEPDSILLPVSLGLRDAPALAVVGAFFVLRGAARATVRAHRGVLARLQRLPPFVPFAAVTTALVAAAHPDPNLGGFVSALAGLLVGLLLALVGMPMADFASSLATEEARPWRELHVATALVTLGTLGCAARGGAVLSAPTVAFGLAMLARGALEDGRDLLRARTSRVAAAARLLLGAAFFLLGTGLLVASTAISLGLVHTSG